ncbi:MAG: hypothetical protein HZC42_02595 [Candidatus Eisenbacteria bacterium]|nr:hypothetical protein [Candidatus Eisenbacteria bacterium]
MPLASDRTGSPVAEPLAAALSLVDEWAAGARAILLSGSHASGEAVWTDVEGLRLSLSDLDTYAVVDSRAAQRAAEARARAALPGLRARLLALGFAAPLEAAFLTAGDLARLAARPGTLELRRHACVVKGEPAWRERVPAWSAGDVSAEERLLLLENRAFELLLAWRGLAAAPALERLQSRHAVMKTALDLAGVLALAAGEYPDGAAARVEAARRRLATFPPGEAAAAAGLPRLWEAALLWRSAPRAAPDPAAARAEWGCAARSWVAVWRTLAGRPGEDAGALALRLAARARARRRWRQALWFASRGGAAPTLGSRLRHARRGTPRHRLNASAALLVCSGALATGSEPALDPVAPALRRLGVLAGPELAGWDAATRALLVAWDRWLLDGQRTEGWR